MVDLHGGKQLGFFKQEGMVSKSVGRVSTCGPDPELGPGRRSGSSPRLALFYVAAALPVVTAALLLCCWHDCYCVAALVSLGLCCQHCCWVVVVVVVPCSSGEDSPLSPAVRLVGQEPGPASCPRRDVGLPRSPPVGLGSWQDCELGVRVPGPHWPGNHTHVPTCTDRKGDRAGSPQAPPGSPL